MAEQNNPRKDGLALIIAGVFVLTLVFLSYRYFNASNSINNEEPPVTTMTQDEANQGPVARLKDAISNITSNNNNSDEEEITDEAASDTKIDTDAFIADRTDQNKNNNTDNSTADTQVKSTDTTKTTTNNQTWTANDYKQGDIKPGNYTVKSGDTLWEIAEAVTGNGANWHQIAQANSGSIGYLPSGQQALITTGQTLVIPQLN